MLFITYFLVYLQWILKTHYETLKKIYSLNRYTILIFFSKKILFHRVFVLLCLLVSFFSSIKSYSQEISIIGLENVHLTDGATIVSIKNDIEVTVITSSSIHNFAKKSIKKDYKTKLPEKKLISEKKNSETRKKEKLLKKLTKPEKTPYVYETNSKSDASFQVTTSILKLATNNQNNFNNSFINSKIDWIVHLNSYQNREYVLYLLYQSKKAENSLFARPPPQMC